MDKEFQEATEQGDLGSLEEILVRVKAKAAQME